MNQIAERQDIAVVRGFWSLVGKYDIQVPRIQRDYAQGRAHGRIPEIRKNFLDHLLDSLFDDKEIKLDFVYGNIIKQGETEIIQLLDGQQRLTTLFLLHWYIAYKEKKLADRGVSSRLEKFTYETRVSSREFCRALSVEGRRIRNNDDSEIVISISNRIKDSVWFFAAWKDDPTIKSMLVMLDAIEEHISAKKGTKGEEQELWSKLTAKELITFYFMPLANFGLSDDLYVKMNARGKPLTPFEEFKAGFEERIKEWNWEPDKIDVRESFASKVDNQWLDLFWDNDPNPAKDDSRIDSTESGYLECITTVAMQCSALVAKGVDHEEADPISPRIRLLHGDVTQVRPTDFRDKTEYQELIETLDLYSQDNEFDKLLIDIPLWDMGAEAKASLFSLLFPNPNIKKKITYQRRALFYAQTLYLMAAKENSFDAQGFSHWMRVSRNIIYDAFKDGEGRIRNFIPAIKLIHNLDQKLAEKGAIDIYEFLADESNKIDSDFQVDAVKHERYKARILRENNLLSQKNNIIFELEDTDFCRGNINFALYCIGYLEHQQLNVGKLKKIKNIFKKYFAEINGEFRRALLTIDDSNFYEYSGSWSSSLENCKYYLIKDIKDLRGFSALDEYRHYLKELVDKLINHSPADIIKHKQKEPGWKSLPSWKQSLIRDNWVIDEGRCYIIPESNINRKSCVILWHGVRPGKYNFTDISKM